MCSCGFDRSLREYLGSGGIYVGVSAGSIILANNLPGSLALLPCRLHVHCKTGTPDGRLTCNLTEISLTDRQAILLSGKEHFIFS